MNGFAIVFGLLVLVAIYLTALAWFAIFSDETLSKFQKTAQSVFAFAVPILGPVTVLHFASPLPNPIDRFVPWPFRSFIAGKPMRKGVGNEEFIDNEDHFNR